MTQTARITERMTQIKSLSMPLNLNVYLHVVKLRHRFQLLRLYFRLLLQMKLSQPTAILKLPTMAQNFQTVQRSARLRKIGLAHATTKRA